MIHGVISDGYYLQVKSLPDEEMSLNQWVLVKTWDVVKPVKNINTEQKKEISS